MHVHSSFSEPYRPQFHFSPRQDWINDPNGLVYYDGEYHLHYQCYPGSVLRGPMHWGQAVSPDLIHWTELPIALYPDHIGETWSGSAVVDAQNTSGLVPGGGLVAMYSYADQSQGIAYSRDRGRTWTKYPGNPVIPVGGKNFRDPKVFWYADIRRWVMVLAAGDRAKFYTSPNLLDWTFVSDFGSEYTPPGSVWECPDLFPLHIDGRTRWVLLASLDGGGPLYGRGICYFIGSFDVTVFTSDDPPGTLHWLDHGPDNYAGITWDNAPDGSRVFIGWMNNWAYAQDIPTLPWRGAMTIPRWLELRRLRNEIRLVQTPVPQIEQLRGAPRTWRSQTVAPGTNLLSGMTGNALDIIAEFQIGTASTFGVNVHQGGGQYTAIGYDTRSHALFVDRSCSGETHFYADFAAVYKAALSPVGGLIKLRIVVDWSSVEVFANDGEVAITAQVFPEAASDGMELFAADGDVMLASLDVYPLRPARQASRN
jgi:fructan beta-fructosidase